MAERGRSNIVEGSLWMIGLTLALFFLPAVNGLIGGLIGGYRVGHFGRALLAAILPSIVVAIGLVLIFALFNAPVWGLFAGATGALIVFLADLGIFVGAAIGGALGQSRAHQRRVTA